jgi:hypothetical protein
MTAWNWLAGTGSTSEAFGSVPPNEVLELETYPPAPVARPPTAAKTSGRVPPFTCTVTFAVVMIFGPAGLTVATRVPLGDAAAPPAGSRGPAGELSELILARIVVRTRARSNLASTARPIEATPPTRVQNASWRNRSMAKVVPAPGLWPVMIHSAKRAPVAGPIKIPVR